MAGTKSGSWKTLNRDWRVNAKHGRYHRRGFWYGLLTDFPAAYFDQNGYVLFPTRDAYESCKQLSRDQTTGHVHVVPPGETIASIRHYRKKRDR